MQNRHFSIIAISLLAIFLSCGKPAVEPSKPIVAVSIPPQKYFVEKIAGDLFDVMVLIPPGASPHTYEPKPAQMVALSRSKIYFSIGVEVEKAWLEKLARSCPGVVFAATDSGIAKIPMEEATESDHDKKADPKNTHSGHEDACDHGAFDPHIWLSPELVRQQSAIITRALSAALPAHASLFRKNDSLFNLEISALQDTIRQILMQRKQDRPFLVFHPSWGYFAREFGLRQLSIETEGKEPSPGELGAIIRLARKNNIKAIYLQPQYSRATAETIAREIGATIAIADPVASNWKENLISCARALGAD